MIDPHAIHSRGYTQKSITTALREMEVDGDDNVVIGGDFNCTLNRTMDKRDGILTTRQHVINSIENIQN